MASISKSPCAACRRTGMPSSSAALRVGRRFCAGWRSPLTRGLGGQTQCLFGLGLYPRRKQSRADQPAGTSFEILGEADSVLKSVQPPPFVLVEPHIVAVRVGHGCAVAGAQVGAEANCLHGLGCIGHVLIVLAPLVIALRGDGHEGGDAVADQLG